MLHSTRKCLQIQYVAIVKNKTLATQSLGPLDLEQTAAFEYICQFRYNRVEKLQEWTVFVFIVVTVLF